MLQNDIGSIAVLHRQRHVDASLGNALTEFGKLPNPFAYTPAKRMPIRNSE